MTRNEAHPAEPARARVDDDARGGRPQDDAPAQVVNSEALMGGATQLAIRHNQSIYFLRQTRFGRLILTK